MPNQIVLGCRKGLVFVISGPPDIAVMLHDYDIDGLTNRPIFTDGDGESYIVVDLTEGE